MDDHPGRPIPYYNAYFAAPAMTITAGPPLYAIWCLRTHADAAELLAIRTAAVGACYTPAVGASHMSCTWVPAAPLPWVPAAWMPAILSKYSMQYACSGPCCGPGPLLKHMCPCCCPACICCTGNQL